MIGILLCAIGLHSWRIVDFGDGTQERKCRRCGLREPKKQVK